MRTAAQDVQVIEDADPDITKLEDAVDKAWAEYWDAKEAKVKISEERQLNKEMQALKDAFDAKHGLTEHMAKVRAAEEALHEACGGDVDYNEEDI